MKHIYAFLWLILALAAPVAGIAQNNVNINDTILSPTEYDTACSSYMWAVNGSVYSQTGEYHDTSRVDGRVHVSTLSLTIYPTPEISIKVISSPHCGNWEISIMNVDTNCSYLWGNSSSDSLSIDTAIIADASDTYYVTIIDTNNCSNLDSMTTVVNPIYSVTDTKTICQDSLPYHWNGVSFTAAGTQVATLQTVNGCDSVVSMTLTVNNTTTGDTTAVACDSFDWYEQTNLTQSGDYVRTITNAAGCDSVVTLHLTINYTTYGDTSATGCDSFIWHGNTYTQTGDYIDTIRNVANCDSIVTLHLIVHHSSHNIDVVTACESYYWHDSTYTISGTHIFRYTNEDCENVDTLYLTINHPIHSGTSVTECDSYMWNGTLYTASDTYTYAHQDINGCWQVDTLHLTIIPSGSSIDTVDTCESYTWNGMQYLSSGVYTKIFSTGKFCDSIATLCLTLHHGTYTSDSVTACESYVWHDSTYKTTGDHIFRYTNADGCENVDTLHLTIHNPMHKAISVNTCESYTWTEGTGATYTVSDDYLYIHVDSNGCTQVDTLHLNVKSPVYYADTVDECESYTWNDISYTTSGDYTQTLTAENGCDSIVTIHLTIYNPVHTAITVSECESYTWAANNQLYSTSGDYTYSHQDAHGCTQVDTLHLTIHNPVHKSISIDTCESYTWTEGTGATYTVSDDYLYIHVDSNGCTQVDTLHLNVKSPVYYADTVDECGSYTWNDILYTTSGDYTQTLTAENGCDSIVTIHLTIYNPVHTAITVLECESYTWAANNQSYSTSGDYTYSHQDAHGCTQVDTLHLTIHNPVHKSIPIDTCESYTWTEGTGATYTVSDDYLYIHVDSNGCTQVDTLHLNIKTPVHTAITVSECGSYTWAANNQSYSTSGDYTYAHQDANGCTQVDTLHLIILNPVHAEITLTECGNYYWNDNNYTTSGDYTGIFSAANGCDSIVTLHLTIIPALQDIKNIVSKMRDGTPYMLVYPDANLQYQWYKNGNAIKNATRQYYYPADYTLESSLDTDACYQVLVAAMGSGVCGTYTDCWTPPASQSTKLRILPNPNNGQFRLQLPEGTVNVQILNVNGQVVMARKVDGDELLEMNTGLANGLYFVKSFREDGNFNTEKLIINR